MLELMVVSSDTAEGVGKVGDEDLRGVVPFKDWFAVVVVSMVVLVLAAGDVSDACEEWADSIVGDENVCTGTLPGDIVVGTSGSVLVADEEETTVVTDNGLFLVVVSMGAFTVVDIVVVVTSVDVLVPL